MATHATEPDSGSGSETTGPTGPAGLAERLDREVVKLDAELTEIEMLVQQVRAETERHEAKRASAADRVVAWRRAERSDPAELAELNGQLVSLTRRAVLMEAQADVLGGKQKALRRHRQAIAALADELRTMAAQQARRLLAPPGTAGPTEPGALAAPSPADVAGADRRAVAAPDAGAGLPPAVSRMVLTVQEDLRRDIARAMHDGPAQSLTNIVLQAQIVERLIDQDPAAAKPEVRQLVAMVQSTLDATKTFIFDVRPMVLDDLGLVPTLRRSARERGRRAQIPVDFESLGQDRRLSVDVESGLFRLLEEALAAYLAGGPDRVFVQLDWSEHLEATVRSVRDAPEMPAAETPVPAPEANAHGGGRGRGKGGPEPELPAALAAMIEDRRGERAAADAATTAPIALSAKAWRDAQARAATLGATAELSPDGAELRVVLELPSDD